MVRLAAAGEEGSPVVLTSWATCPWCAREFWVDDRSICLPVLGGMLVCLDRLWSGASGCSSHSAGKAGCHLRDSETSALQVSFCPMSIY